MKLRTWSMLVLFVVALTVGACAEEQAADPAGEAPPVETEENPMMQDTSAMQDTAAVEMDMNMEAGTEAGSDQDP